MVEQALQFVPGKTDYKSINLRNVVDFEVDEKCNQNVYFLKFTCTLIFLGVGSHHA